MSHIGKTLGGRYVLERQLGRGGMASVFLAKDLKEDVKVAVKLLRADLAGKPGAIERFRREAHALIGVQHKGVVEVLNLSQSEDGLPFLVMAYVAGQTVSGWLTQHRAMTAEQLRDFSSAFLDALSAAHAASVIHRDLKPDNLILGNAPKVDSVIVIDFGISAKTDAPSNLTVEGSALGTPHYMSPEQARGARDLDSRTDVYSAAAVLYQCATGAVPFEGANYNALMRSIQDAPVVPPNRRGAKLPPSVEAVLVQAMNKDASLRPRDAADFLRRLAAAWKNPGSVQDGAFFDLEQGLDLEVLESPAPRRATHINEHDASPVEADLELQLEHSAPNRSQQLVKQPVHDEPLDQPEQPDEPSKLKVLAVQGIDLLSRVPKLAWLILVGAIGLLMAIVFVRSNVPVVEAAPIAPPPPIEEPLAPTERWVNVRVEGLPHTARLSLDGLPGVRLPIRVRAGSAHTLTVAAPGYVTATVPFEGQDGLVLRPTMRVE